MSLESNNNNDIITNDIAPEATTNASVKPKSGVSRRNFLKYSAGAAVGAASFSSFLAACSAGGFGNSSGSSGGNVTIQFWDANWGSGTYFDTAQKLVTEFNNTHKGITVKYTGIPWNNWYQNFTTAVGSGTAPDICTGGTFMGVQFDADNDVLALDDVVSELKSNGQYNDFLPGAFDAMTYKGHTITFPFSMDIRIPFYRTDMFQAAGIKNLPTTWDEWRTAAKTLTKNGKYGFIQPGADNVTEHMLEALMINNGAGLFSPDGQLDFSNNPRNVQALQFFADMVADGSFDPASVGYASADVIKAFSRGDAAMTVGGPAWTAQMDATSAKQVAVIPPMTGSTGMKGTINWICNMLIFKQTKHPNETKEFMLWWSQNNKPLWTQGGCSPIPIRSSFYSDSYFDTPIIKAIRSDYVPIAKGAYAQANTIFPALNDFDGDGTLETLGQNLLQKKNFQTSIATAETGLQNIMKKYPA
ncbi:MAG TPA: sugar ABC transporter substrate-binding protein [Dictyobacter sp.]|jgi:multiple sugar transport system substrate-binding protein|nr:sugar ABC transporter substrate-binding protein [Dictyobacter sp.]